MKLCILLLGTLLAFTACRKVTYISQSTVPTGQVSEETGRYFIAGLFGTKEIRADQICPQGVSKVQSKFTFGDMVLTVITFAIYTPRTYEIHCGRAMTQPAAQPAEAPPAALPPEAAPPEAAPTEGAE